MTNRVVLIPFDRANSDDHVLSTKGGFSDDVFRQQVQEIEAIRDRLFGGWGMLLNERQKMLLRSGSNRSTDLNNLLPGNANEETAPQVVLGRKEGLVSLSDRWLALPQKIRKQALEIQQKVEEAHIRLADGVPGWRKVDPRAIVCADDEHLASMLNRLGECDEDVLYIRGHCDKGLSTLTSSDHTAKIEVGQVIELLNGKLPKHYKGKIKIFACSSSRDAIANDSFAYRFAALLSKAGWLHTRVFGYSESLGSYVSDGESAWPAPVPAGHKVASEHGVRAKLVRQEIRPPVGGFA